MNKKALLEVFQQISDTTEYEENDIRSFLQVRQYKELQDPSKMLIVGGRGAGKTRVFRTLIGKDGFRHVIGDSILYNRPDYTNSSVLVGYSTDYAALPTQAALGKFCTEGETSAFWAGAVVLELLSYFEKDEIVQTMAQTNLGESLFALLHEKNILKSPSQWVPVYLKNPEPWEIFLDEIDELLVERNRWIFFAYDQIDRISTESRTLYSYIRSLVSYWFSVSGRWRRLKCKIFIRTDLLNSDSMHFPDASKVSARKIDLSWNIVALYRLLIRRLANAQSDAAPAMIGYLEQISGLVQKHELIGYLPSESEDKIREFVKRLIGPYMGTSPKKGDSYLWVPNHLQDANGDLSPRSFLKCYSCAAQTMLQPGNEKALEQLSGTALLSPSAIQGAVQEVSSYRVKELEEDFPWITSLKDVLEGKTLLMQEEDFKKCLEDLLSKKPTDLPANSIDKLEDLLISLGIILKSPDKRINMPEIYLHGFGLKRKGGLRRLS